MTSSASEKTQRRIVFRILFRFTVPGLFMIACLLLSSGDWAWAEAWALVLLTVVLNLVPQGLAARRHPGYLEERLQHAGRTDVPKWDRLLAPGVALIGPALLWITAGLDRRFFWTAFFPAAWEFEGLVVYVLGATLAGWAMVENAFFSPIIRVQTDRGQTAVRTGPYRFLRHPGYAGGVLCAFSAAIALGSYLALIPAGILIILLILRTDLEDKTLLQGLPGYAEYAKATPFRILPGIW